MKRRTFVAAAAAAAIPRSLFADSQQPRRVAVIGHTGRGNYGHGLDVVWTKFPNVEVVGVADPNESGLRKTLSRVKIDQGFTDYRKMLQKLRPEFVSVAPRHPDQHLEMALAAIKSGAKGLYVEKPFCRSPHEADQLIAAAEEYGAQIAVAHRNRYHPALPTIKQLVADGKIGRLLEIRGHGLGDRRGGAEDLWVLGGHVFNLMHYFAGDPTSCSATVLQNGRPATKQDVVDGAEGLGPLAGNEIHARWLLSSGITATYDTFTNDGSNKTGYATHLIGTEGSISLHIDRDPIAWIRPGNPFDPTSRGLARIPVTTAGPGKQETQPELIAEVHNHVVAIRDLIDAVDNRRPPLCDARQGAMTVEMICSVFESHRQGGAFVPLPLTERDNPLSRR